jgi:pimeloyl-ACP methyl ester carboxylesterase
LAPGRRKKRTPRSLALAAIALPVVAPALLLALATVAHLALPVPDGPYALGRLRLSWSDRTRQEVLTPAESDVREIIAEVWYPAQAKTGGASPYFPELPRVSAGLVQSGELRGLQVWGLQFVRAHAHLRATVADEAARFPVVLLSPGNATNAEFYASFAEDLASHGIVVVGLNHPYDVAAVALADGAVAVLAPPGQPAREYIAARVAERVADARFVLDRLSELDQGDSPLARHLDLSRVGIMGHSLGGLTAAQACAADARFTSCLNLDGLQEGGPFSVQAGGAAPRQPFMLITKASTLPPAAEQRLRSLPNLSLVVIPDAAHRDFSDGPLFEPSFNPFTRRIDRINLQIREELREFFLRTLGG